MKTKSQTEILAGFTTFFTMSYIVVVNPSILSTEGTGMTFSGVMTATVLLSFLMTLLMGLYAKLPFAVAPGMGINSFFTFTVLMQNKVPWPKALGAVFWAGVLFIVLSILPVRRKIAASIPHHLRHSISVGIGLFLTFIGLKNMGLVVSDPVTIVKLGPLNETVLLSLLGFLVVIIGVAKKSPFAFLAGIFTVSVLALARGHIHWPAHVFSAPDFKSVFFKLDIWGALDLSLLPTIIAILFTDFFDSISTFIGLSQSTKMLDRNGDPLRMKQALLVDAFATTTAGLFGTSSGTAYIESAAGIEVGGRTGLTAIVTALCFLPCFFIAPLAGVVPAYATAPVLVLVGAMMFGSVAEFKTAAIEDMLPGFLSIVLIPLTFSITQGILWAFIAHVLLYCLRGRRKELTPIQVGLAVVSVLLLWIEQHS